MKTLRLSLCFLLLSSWSLFASADDLVNAEVMLHALGNPVHDHGAFIVRQVDGKFVCTDATPQEAARIKSARNVETRIFGEDAGPVRTNASAGLNIILRGTAQLDANPDAKAAFERAAEIWESRIANEITVYVDVDYGTTRFGMPFDEDVIASADSDYRGGTENLYTPIRNLVLARGDNANETALYNSLPLNSLPTDIGSTTRVVYPSIQLRAIGGLPATAANADPAPSIGFNSAFAYDFEPSNGITPGKQDFEGVVVHEIGHMLGFVSRSGGVELGGTNSPTIFDFFRFRPGVTNGTFTGAQRVQSSGGNHVYFTGVTALAMSTGRPDGTSGDERQASHWKDDALAGTRIGIMDPTLSAGVRSEITDADVQAFGMMGFEMVAPSAGCSESEPNESAANADDLGLPGTCSGNVNEADAWNVQINYNDGTSDHVEDLFKITLGTAAKIKVTLTFNSGDLDAFLMTISGPSVTVLGLSATNNPSTETFTTANTLSPGTYYVGVSAFDGSSAYTIAVEAVGALAPPTAPSNLHATGTSSSVIQLTWNDNSNNESEFRIEQKVGAGFLDIGAAPANATSINVTDFEPSTSATFRVRARGAGGDSAYSNEATGTTQGQPSVCTPNATTVCLLSNRFRVKIDYVNPFSNPPNQPGTFLAARLSSQAGINPDVGLFGFSSAQAIEVVVRVQDTRPFAPRFDIYYGGMTDVGYTITVTDTQTGTTRQYSNTVGNVGGGVDRNSFPAN